MKAILYDGGVGGGGRKRDRNDSSVFKNNVVKETESKSKFFGLKNQFDYPIIAISAICCKSKG